MERRRQLPTIHPRSVGRTIWVKRATTRGLTRPLLSTFERLPLDRWAVGSGPGPARLYPVFRRSARAAASRRSSKPTNVTSSSLCS
jgi:hypothetical protein